MMSEPTTTKWYDKKGLVVLLCIVFFPVGLYALWMSRTIGKGWKIGVSVFFGLVVLSSIGDKEGDSSSNSKEMAQHAQLTQAQKDSIAMAEQARKEERAREAKEKAIEERRKATIDATDLWTAYDDNEVGADGKYKGKTLYVAGRIVEIGQDSVHDGPVIELRGGGYFGTVVCEIKDKATVAQVQKGQWVSIRGKCSGRDYAKDVKMENCEMVESLEDMEAGLQ